MTELRQKQRRETAKAAEPTNATEPETKRLTLAAPEVAPEAEPDEAEQSEPEEQLITILRMRNGSKDIAKMPN